MSWGTFTHNVARLIPAECRPYACDAIETLIAEQGIWYSFTDLSGSIPFPTPTPYVLSQTYNGFGWNVANLPVGKKVVINTCDDSQQTAYFRQADGTTGVTPTITQNVRKVGDDQFRAVIGPYGQTLVQNSTDNFMRTQFQYVWYATRNNGGVNQYTGRVNIEGVDLSGDGTHDHLRVIIAWPGTAISSAPTDGTTVDDMILLSDMLSVLNDPTVSGYHTFTLVETYDIPYSEMFPDSDYLWCPIEIDISLSDDVDYLRVDPTRFNAINFWAVQGSLTIRVGSNTISIPSRADLYLAQLGDSSSASFGIDEWKVDPGSGYTVNNYFYTPGVTNGHIAIGGIGDTAVDYDEFVIALNRNRSDYTSPAYCYSGQAECREYSCKAILESYASYASGGWSSLVTGESAWTWPFPLGNGFTNNAGSFGPGTGANTLDVPSGQAVPISSCDAQEDLFIQVSGNPATYKPYQLNDQRYFMVLGPYGLDLVSTDNASEMKWVSFFEHQYTNTNSNSPGTTFTSYEQTSLIFSSEDSGSDSVHDRLRVTAKIFGGSVVAVDLIDYADIFDGSGSLWVPVEVGISTTTPVEVSGRWESDVTFTVRVGEHSQTYTFSDQDITGGTIDIVSWATEDLSEINTGNRPLSNLNGSQVVALGGIGIAPDDMEYSEFKLAFERNRSTYTTPEYC